MCRFVPPSEEMAKRMGISFDEWEIGKQGPLKVAYPATIPEADLIIQEVRPVMSSVEQIYSSICSVFCASWYSSCA